MATANRRWPRMMTQDVIWQQGHIQGQSPRKLRFTAKLPRSRRTTEAALPPLGRCPLGGRCRGQRRVCARVLCSHRETPCRSQVPIVNMAHEELGAHEAHGRSNDQAKDVGERWRGSHQAVARAGAHVHPGEPAGSRRRAQVWVGSGAACARRVLACGRRAGALRAPGGPQRSDSSQRFWPAAQRQVRNIEIFS